MKRRKTILLFLGISSLFLLQFALFRFYSLREIVNFYPRNYDQQSYLMMIYLTYSSIQKHGLIYGLLNTPYLTTGPFFIIQTVLFFLITSASRFNAILLNFIYFISLQAFVFYISLKLTNKIYFSTIFIGLILLTMTPFHVPGGITDYRIDFMAFCLYGTFITAIVRSYSFLDRKWSVIAALIAIWMISIRLITMVYIFGTVGSFFIYLLFQKTQRIKNILLFGSILGLILIPYCLINFETIHNYYVIGHFTGKEKYIRELAAGVSGIVANITYYPSKLQHDQIGNINTTIILLLLVGTCLVSKIKSYSNHGEIEKINGFSKNIIFLSLSIISPLIILSLDLNKNSVVSSVMVIPVYWIAMLIFLKLETKIRKGKIKTFVFTFIAVFILSLGLLSQAQHYLKSSSAQNRHDMVEITRMYLNVGDYATQKNWPKVSLSTGQVVDYLSNGDVTTLYFEQKHKYIEADINKLGGIIYTISKADAIKSMNNSNVIILSLDGNVGTLYYPFNRSVDKMTPDIIKYANDHFKILNDYTFKGHEFRVYVK